MPLQETIRILLVRYSQVLHDEYRLTQNEMLPAIRACLDYWETRFEEEEPEDDS